MIGCVQATIYKCNDDGTLKALQAYSDTDVSVNAVMNRFTLDMSACTCMWICLHVHAI